MRQVGSIMIAALFVTLGGAPSWGLDAKLSHGDHQPGQIIARALNGTTNINVPFSGYIWHADNGQGRFTVIEAANRTHQVAQGTIGADPLSLSPSEISCYTPFENPRFATKPIGGH